MSLVPITVTWTRISGDTNGSTYRGQGTAFNTDTRAIEAFDQRRVAATLDPVPANVRLVAGDYLHSECDDKYTRYVWTYNGNGGTTTAQEPNSPFCGYTPPATCDLGKLTVTQKPTASGATLLVAFSGSVNGTAYYSVDGGAEQTSPQLLRVPAGQHKVKLRDDGLAGCERVVDVEIKGASTIPVLPPPPAGPSAGIDFVGQPLWYSLAGHAPGTLVQLQLYAESSHGAGDYALVLTLDKRFNAKRQVDFRLDTLLLPLLSAFVPPAVPVATMLCTTNLVNYFVRTLITPLDVAQLPVSAVSGLRTALRGGLPGEWQEIDYFAFRLSEFAAPAFLSWQPTGAGAYAAGQAKPVVSTQPEWLHFPCELGLANAQLQIRRTYFLTEGGPATVDIEKLTQPAGSWAQRLLAIPLLPGRSGFTYLSVRVETQAGVAVSQEARYRFVQPSPRTRYLLFTNSLGGLDTLRCADKARLEVSLEATTEKVERPARRGELGPAADRRVSELTASRKLRLAIGWQLPAELDWLQELVLSREVWQQVGAQLRPLDWPKRSLVPYAEEPGLRGLLLECDYAYAPTAYAPVTYA
jgi:hypothetical protein